MEGFDKKDDMQEGDSKFREEIFSKAVRAGKRTYFFDVKATRKDEYYLTMTESKKRYDQEGNFHFEKHKIFLYKEDFEKFSDGLSEVIDFIKASQSMEDAEIEIDMTMSENEEDDVIATKDYTNVDFDDLNN
ncbi:DUF3276 family protein [uncultured Sunxiuqinia sp.]|jgi:uncharacterized protein DUF3276|uniref:DUF3276 family protein n=1 Tax=uncultured Sunxiuqinia sp. TaxID=1573825 RepID=UPI00199D1DA7|nr:PUR family DNA/RNA-binding protein [Sunxiuqinia sp.]|tara:strand:- start:68502 stop:68897 length:396 start_codon:yes stop_codon:yes gene_type:complete